MVMLVKNFKKNFRKGTFSQRLFYKGKIFVNA